MNSDDERSDRADRENAERGAVKRALSDYHAASQALDERPSAQARAAILAAAAREVGAQPRDAAATGAPLRPRRGALRWPMAAAATVLLSSLAVMMAERVEQSQTVAEISPPAATPAATATDSRAAADEPAVAIAPPPTADAAAEKPTTAPPVAAPRSIAPPEPRRARQELPPPEASAAEAARERSVEQRASAAPAPLPAPPAPPVPSALSAPPVAPAPSAPAAGAAPSIAQPPERAAADTATTAKPEAAPMAKEFSRRDARSEASLGAAQRADAPPAEAEQGTLSAADWLARIIRLREAGRHAEADAQLQRFRQRYPQVKVPEPALLPAGTR